MFMNSSEADDRGFFAKLVKVARREYFKPDHDLSPEAIAHAVFALLAKRITAGEIEDVKHILPVEIRELSP
jgi:uncharacterized protein (DUF2267 family)